MISYLPIQTTVLHLGPKAFSVLGIECIARTRTSLIWSSPMSMHRLKFFIDQYALSQGLFKEVKISKRQKKLYKRYGIVPMDFLFCLKEMGFTDIVEVFKNYKNSMRTVEVVFSYLQNSHNPIKSLTALENAIGKLTGNRRYHEFHSRERPETTYNNYCDRLT